MAYLPRVSLPLDGDPSLCVERKPFHTFLLRLLSSGAGWAAKRSGLSKSVEPPKAEGTVPFAAFSTPWKKWPSTGAPFSKAMAPNRDYTNHHLKIV